MAVCCRNNNKPKAMKEQICINLRHLISTGTDFQKHKMVLYLYSPALCESGLSE